MAEVKFTKEQQLAIDSRNKNIIVSAQAGAGKTQVLVGRIISLLEESRIDISDMLIVTFTNKAAREMKDRIKSDLAKLMQNENLSEEDQKYYQDQYKKTNDAQISTMHSFGINVLRQYFYKIGLNPGFKILTNTNLDILKWESMGEVFDKYYREEDKDFENLLTIYSNGYQDDNVKNVLFNIYEFIQSQLNPFEWLEKYINHYKSKDYYLDNEDNLENFKNIVFNHYKIELENLINKFEETFDKIEKIDSYEHMYTKAINSDREILGFLKSVDTLDKLNDLVNLYPSMERKVKPKKAVVEEYGLDSNDIDQVKNLMEIYRVPYKKFVSNLDIDIQKEIEYEDQVLKSLLIIEKLLKEYHQTLAEKKAEKEALDFSDIEHLTLDLLKDQDVVENIRKKYKYIFFDEYQDANQIQNEIVNKIARKDNLFFVGDIKQSIYKFRLADPTIFKNRYESYQKDQLNNLVIDLFHNFRTERKLLQFNNHIFNNLMTDELGDVDYNTEEHRLAPGKKDYIDENGKLVKAYDDNNTRIELDYIIKDSDDNDDEEDKLVLLDKEMENIHPESLLVAKRIKEILSRGYSYKDIAILARSKAIFPDIMMILENEGIPFFYESSGFSYDDIEIKVFIEILKAINNDTDDITLLTALTSTIANFTDEELAHIRFDDKKHSFNYCFKNYKSRSDSRPEIVDKINIYNNKMTQYRSLEKTMSIEELAWYVFIDSGYMSYVLSKIDGERILSNIKLFISEIGDIESNSYQTLTSYINYLENVQKRKLLDRDSNAELSEEDNVVRLMTMHKSKGLQFKATILVNLAKRFNTRDLSGTAIMNDDLGISLKAYNHKENSLDKSLRYKQIEDIKKSELYSEEMRILYVALTRAENELHLISSGKETSYDASGHPLEMDSYHKWIYSVMLNEDITSPSFKDIINIKKHLKDDLFREIFGEVELQKNNRSNLLENEYSFRVKDRIEEILSYRYDDSLVDVPYKKTVTQISAKDENKDESFKDYDKLTEKEIYKTDLNFRPKFISEDEESELDSLELGSLYHYVFEKLPFKDHDKNTLNLYIEDLRLKKFISSKEARTIDLNLLLNFVESPLYERLKNADRQGLLKNESSFTMQYIENGNNIKVDGQIDLYFEEEDGFVILDYKTNKHVDETIYIEQLNLYAQALEKATRKKVKEKIIYWIMHGQVSYL